MLSIKNKLPIIINASLFQACWFACVIGGANELTWPAVVTFLILAIYQLHPDRRHSRDALLLLVSIPMALLVDSFWVASGMMTFTESFPFAGIAPLWIIILWCAFALTVNHSLAWLKAHPSLPIVFGGFGGPMSYFAGLKLGGVEYHSDFWLVSLALALAWSISLLVLCKLGGAFTEQNSINLRQAVKSFR